MNNQFRGFFATFFDAKYYFKAIMVLVLVLSSATEDVQCTGRNLRHRLHKQRPKETDRKTTLVITGSRTPGLGSGDSSSRGTMNQAYAGPSQGGNGH